MKTILPLALLAAAFVTTPASAQTAAPSGVHVVSYADLNLASDAGRRQLDRRIGAAVRDACGAASDADLHGKNAVARCRSEAWGQAQAQRAVALASARLPSDRLAAGQ
jgi:UrcA family protein